MSREIPLFDTLRLFISRALNGKSPLSAFRNHIHHRLLDLGFSHMQTSVLLLCVNIFFLLFAYFAQGLKGELFLLLVLVIALGPDRVLCFFTLGKR